MKCVLCIKESYSKGKNVKIFTFAYGQPDREQMWKFWPFFPWNMILWCKKHILFHCEGLKNAFIMPFSWLPIETMCFDGSSYCSLVPTLLSCQYITYWISVWNFWIVALFFPLHWSHGMAILLRLFVPVCPSNQEFAIKPNLPILNSAQPYPVLCLRKMWWSQQG